MKLEVKSIDGISAAASTFLDALDSHKVVAFYGEMGVGKTTFINELSRQMGIEDHASSPTFSIVNEYFSVNYGSIFHFDFYRIKDEFEALDIGVEEIFDGDNFCFIEWPERIENLLPDNCVSVYITKQGTCRIIETQP